jgi:hypothetical protein
MPYFKDNCPVTLRITSSKIRTRITYLTITPFLEKMGYMF